MLAKATHSKSVSATQQAHGSPAVFYSIRDAAPGGVLGEGGSPTLQRLSQRFGQLQTQASELSIPNQFGAILQRAGGVQLNASTSPDATRYFVSLPTNALELWFALEAERFQARRLPPLAAAAPRMPALQHSSRNPGPFCMPAGILQLLCSAMMLLLGFALAVRVGHWHMAAVSVSTHRHASSYCCR